MDPGGKGRGHGQHRARAGSVPMGGRRWWHHMACVAQWHLFFADACPGPAAVPLRAAGGSSLNPVLGRAPHQPVPCKPLSGPPAGPVTATCCWSEPSGRAVAVQAEPAPRHNAAWGAGAVRQGQWGQWGCPASSAEGASVPEELPGACRPRARGSRLGHRNRRPRTPRRSCPGGATAPGGGAPVRPAVCERSSLWRHGVGTPGGQLLDVKTAALKGSRCARFACCGASSAPGTGELRGVVRCPHLVRSLTWEGVSSRPLLLRSPRPLSPLLLPVTELRGPHDKHVPPGRGQELWRGLGDVTALYTGRRHSPARAEGVAGGWEPPPFFAN